LAKESAAIEVFELHGIPLFNKDEEQPLPTRVLELKQPIRQQVENVVAWTPRVGGSGDSRGI
jgi:hypothetical protein